MISIIVPSAKSDSATVRSIMDLLRVGASVRARGVALEVLIIVNGPKAQELKHRIEGAYAEHGTWWQVSESKPVGVNHARNQGAALAKHPVLLFLDDDVRFESTEILLQICEYSSRAESDWAAGGTYRTVSTGSVGKVYGQIQENFQLALERNSGLPFFMGGFLLLPKELFQRLGGFDEEVVWGGAELAINEKLRKSGARLERPPTWSIEHQPELDLSQLVRKGLRQGLGSKTNRVFMTGESTRSSSFAERAYHTAFFIGLSEDKWRERFLRRPRLLLLLMVGATIRVDYLLDPAALHFIESAYWKIRTWSLRATGRNWDEIQVCLSKEHLRIDGLRKEVDFVRKRMELTRRA